MAAEKIKTKKRTFWRIGVDTLWLWDTVVVDARARRGEVKKKNQRQRKRTSSGGALPLICQGWDWGMS